jgi:hypothetical protein
VAPLAALLLITLPALRPAEKYLGSWLWWIPYFLVCISLIHHVTKKQTASISKLLRSPVFIWGVPFVLAVISTIFYPRADALKLEMQGQDQDDCTILGVNAIFLGANPVSTPTYFGNPCSNMLGAIIPHIPFVLMGLMGLAGPIFLAIAVAILYFRKVDRLQIGLFVAIVAGTPASLELMVNGSDFVFIGFMSLVSSILVSNSVSSNFLSNKVFYPLALLVGLIASTRINMPIFALPFGLILLTRKNRWLLFTFLVSLIVIVPNLIVFLSSPDDFAPLHLISKGQSLVPGVFYFLMFAATGVAIVLGYVLWRKSKVDELSLVLLIVSPHLIFLAFGDLIFNRRFDFFWWEGANYLFLLTPMLAWYAVTRLVVVKEGK